MNINELNEELMNSEKNILERSLKLSDIKKQYELLRLNINNSFDTTQKEYSNQQKRDSFIDASVEVVELSKSIKKLEYELAVLRIECDHKHRTFEIMLKSELI